MKVIKELAREIAARDEEKDLDPPTTIEEMLTVLGALVWGAYEKERTEIPSPAKRTLVEAIRREKRKATRVVSEERRAELVEWLRLRAQEHNWRGYRTMFEEIRRALAGPTKRELDLDELLHSSYMETVLRFAEQNGALDGSITAKKIREWRMRI
jgi:hypothetical protein